MLIEAELSLSVLNDPKRQTAVQRARFLWHRGSTSGTTGGDCHAVSY